jgi:DNA polymerase-3 subunit delta'
VSTEPSDVVLAGAPDPVIDGPVAGLYTEVPGQARAVAALEAAARRPVHAYLLVGPAGTGKSAAARRFAAALLTSPVASVPGSASAPGALPPPEVAVNPGSVAETRRRVLAGIHPDVLTVEREGPAISMDMAREVVRLAARSPLEGARKVLILPDFHLVRDAGPALLKTIEEPPPSTVFVVLAEYVPPELVTIASRCVRVDFAPLPPALVVELLVAEGASPELAADLAQASGGRLDRARLLASDPEFELRRRTWRSVPDELDGSGATAARLADRLVALLDDSVAPMRLRHEAELAALEERNTRAVEVNGKVGRGARSGVKAGVRETEERHKREVRRQRTDELRSGLATLAGAYRDRLAAPGSSPSPASPASPASAASAASAAWTASAASTASVVEAVGLIDALGADLAYNPGEGLALLALLVRLGQLRLPGAEARSDR